LADGAKGFATDTAFKKRRQTHPPINHSFFRKVFHLDATGGANINAGAAANAVLARLAKGGSGFAIRASALETDRRLANEVPADIHTQAAENALLSQGLFQIGVKNPEPGREFADDRRTETPREQQFNDCAAVLLDSLRVGGNFQTISFDGKVARRDDANPPAPLDLDHANPADAVRLQRRMMTERGDLNSHFATGLEDGSPLRHGHRHPVNL
jgi:hypothetical protein